VTTPCLWFSRGEPKAKLLGDFESSLAGSTATPFGSLSQHKAGSHGPLGDKERSGQSMIDSMNERIFFKNFFSVPLLCVPKECGTPKSVAVKSKRLDSKCPAAALQRVFKT